jgi:hypothetical protein
MKTFTYRKRLFLQPVSTSDTSHILAEVESSRGGVYRWGHYMLRIADSETWVEYEFFVSNAGARRRSLDRIDRLIRELEKFQIALHKEAELIANCARKN